jgi:hypothetical protein
MPIPQCSPPSDLDLATRLPSRPIFQEEPPIPFHNPFTEHRHTEEADDDLYEVIEPCEEDAEVISRLVAHPSPTEHDPPAPFIVPQLDRASPRPKKLTRLTEEEKIAIIRGRDANRSYQDIADQLHRSEAGCRQFYEKWERTHRLREQWGGPVGAGEREAARVIELVLANHRSTVIQVGAQACISRETARLIRHRQGYHYDMCIPRLRLTEHAKTTRVAFANREPNNPDNRVIILTDESMAAQDLNIGASGRKGKKFSRKELMSKTTILFR